MQGAGEMRERAEVALRTGAGKVFRAGQVNYAPEGPAPRGNGLPGAPGMIEVRLHELIAARGLTLAELSHRVGVTVVNLSVLKNGHARAIRFSTLARLCEVLDCQPGDLLSWHTDADEPPARSPTGTPSAEMSPANGPPAERFAAERSSAEASAAEAQAAGRGAKAR